MNWIEAYSEASTAAGNCVGDTTKFWKQRWFDRMKQLEDLLPHGSGIDDRIFIDSCTDRRITGHFDFHHMNGGGFYDGWVGYTFTVVATFNGIDVALRGQDKDGLRDYLGDLLHEAFTAAAPAYPWEDAA